MEGCFNSGRDISVAASLPNSENTSKSITVVSHIYDPSFATLALVENIGGAYMRDLTFCLMNTPGHA